MQPHAFFIKCAEIEEEVGKLYSRFASLLADHPEPAAIFTKIAEDESNHANLMRMLSRLVMKMRENVAVRDNAGEISKTVEEWIHKTNLILDAGKPLTPKTAFLVGMKLEENLIENHSPSLIFSDSEELNKTIKILLTDTSRHLEQFKEGLKRLPPEA